MHSLITRNLFFVTLLTLIASVSHAENTASKSPKFRGSPVPALRLAATMITHTDEPPVSQAEMAFFEDMAAGRQSNWTLSDVALMASGVQSEAERQHYLARFGELTAGAQQAAADCQTEHEAAAAIAKFLFKQMPGGFVSGQVDMRRVLETGEFNCVSSAILFEIISSRLGIKTVSAHIPGHVFVRIPDLEIEMTSGKTYSVASHQKILDKEWAKASQLTKDAFGYNHIYETSSLAMVGEIYYDQGIDLGKEKSYGKAVVANLKACCIDPANPTFRSVLEAKLRSWFTYNIEQKRFDRAHNVIKIYAGLFGSSSTVAQMASKLSNAANTGTRLAQAR